MAEPLAAQLAEQAQVGTGAVQPADIEDAGPSGRKQVDHRVHRPIPDPGAMDEQRHQQRRALEQFDRPGMAAQKPHGRKDHFLAIAFEIEQAGQKLSRDPRQPASARQTALRAVHPRGIPPAATQPASAGLRGPGPPARPRFPGAGLFPGTPGLRDRPAVPRLRPRLAVGRVQQDARRHLQHGRDPGVGRHGRSHGGLPGHGPTGPPARPLGGPTESGEGQADRAGRLPRAAGPRNRAHQTHPRFPRVGLRGHESAPLRGQLPPAYPRRPLLRLLGHRTRTGHPGRQAGRER